MKSAYAQLLAQGQADTVQLPILDSAPQEPDFQAIHGELYAEAANAAIDPDTARCCPTPWGVDFDTAQDAAPVPAGPGGRDREVPSPSPSPTSPRRYWPTGFADLLGRVPAR